MNLSCNDGESGDCGLRWNNRFASLGPAFFTRQLPQPLPAPYWVATNQALARELDLNADWLGSEAALHAFSGNTVLPGSEPLASVYSGHQFGVWAGQLGDGRALLLGELQTPQGPMELQLKGSGLTPYSHFFAVNHNFFRGNDEVLVQNRLDVSQHLLLIPNIVSFDIL